MIVTVIWTNEVCELEVIISSRTPEGQPNQCPLCGKFLRIALSHPTNDAPCPHCGHLLLFVRDPDDASLVYFYNKEYQPDDVPDYILELIPVSVGRENAVVPVDESQGSLIVASPRPVETETMEKLRFILNRQVSNVVIPLETFERLRRRHEEM